MLSYTNNGARIALTGFMGVGKSSVARHLALLLHCERVDLDSFIEAFLMKHADAGKAPPQGAFIR